MSDHFNTTAISTVLVSKLYAYKSKFVCVIPNLLFLQVISPISTILNTSSDFIYILFMKVPPLSLTTRTRDLTWIEFHAPKHSSWRIQLSLVSSLNQLLYPNSGKSPTSFQFVSATRNNLFYSKSTSKTTLLKVNSNLI